MQGTLLDQYIARLQNLHGFNVYSIQTDGLVQPWYEVTGLIVKDLVVDEATLAAQVQTIAAQIGHWGRLAAQCKRVWEVEERGYRRWRDQKILEMIEPPSNPEAAKGWKKPTESIIEATYRTDPDYNVWNEKIERAEEAYNAAVAIQEAFKAKKDVLVRYVVRYRDENQPHLVV